MSDGDQGASGEEIVSLFEDSKFAAETQEFVDDQAPRLFAVVQETFDPEDVRIVAWGMTTEKGVEVFPVEGGTHLSLQSAENALIFFRAGGRALPRVMWVGGEREE
ncbi:hypothetical protein ACQPZF_07205 [Actinosynnema sp. CS-041913]|uniref:hypothetical protein n=1 Tax=Actinosynnema sp. CS-041913 TaxID=3239917 RepID=UPI003D8AF861